MKFDFWNTFFILLFIVLLAAGVRWLFTSGSIFYDVPMRDILLMTLATFRLTRLASYDAITQFIRDWFSEAKKGTISYTLGVLANCPWCTGLWFGFLVVFSYFAFTIYAWPVILVLAIAALASFLQIIANAIGWIAEGKKRDVLSK